MNSQPGVHHNVEGQAAFGSARNCDTADEQTVRPLVERTSEHLPGTTALLNVNGPLLSNSYAYSCLEHVLPAKLKPRRRPAVLDTMRATSPFPAARKFKA